MKKQDLKAGMVVEVRGGKRYLYSSNNNKASLVELLTGIDWDVLDTYGDDLLYNYSCEILNLFGPGEMVAT